MIDPLVSDLGFYVRMIRRKCIKCPVDTFVCRRSGGTVEELGGRCTATLLRCWRDENSEGRYDRDIYPVKFEIRGA
jgi:hypothetical protein